MNTLVSRLGGIDSKLTDETAMAVNNLTQHAETRGVGLLIGQALKVFF